MSPKELGTNTALKPHGHWVMAIKDLKDGHKDEIKGSFKPDLISIERATENLTSVYQFTEFNKSYAFYEKEATEYLRFEGTVSQLQLQLTIDVFTCYCEPLNENQEPPF